MPRCAGHTPNSSKFFKLRWTLLCFTLLVESAAAVIPCCLNCEVHLELLWIVHKLSLPFSVETTCRQRSFNKARAVAVAEESQGQVGQCPPKIFLGWAIVPFLSVHAPVTNLPPPKSRNSFPWFHLYHYLVFGWKSENLNIAGRCISIIW